MAEAAMFSVATKLLSTIASPAFEKAYNKACSIKSAREDLSKLKRSVKTIQAVLLDAEKKQDSSAGVKEWIKRVRDVLYDADDLFDEVAADDMLRKRINGGNKLMKKVRDSWSSLNPIVSNNSIAKRVKDIRKRLLEISKDMKLFQFVECLDERPIGGIRQGQDRGLLFVDPEKVIGRVKDKKAILQMLVAESSTDVSVIAIVGIGGMGKTTLSQLVYNDDEVQRIFGENRWFVCISDTSIDKEVIGKIYQSTCVGGRHEDLAIIELQSQIREKMKGRKFLLVLDDVWDEDRGRWQDRMSSLSGGAKGSKVIVTTRSVSVARALGSFKTHNLDGFSEEESWDLFKSIVSFTPEQERDSRWTTLGREIVKKCANVPLAVKSIASLLFEKNTLQEWESFRNEELPKLGLNHKEGIMHVLRLSYDHLPSNLKHCFAYCSLFPKDHVFDKDDLIQLWISQGYVKTTCDSQSIEDVGHSYFMDLFRRSFLQVNYGFRDINIKCCTMHDLIHDLAQDVARDESIILTRSSGRITCERHVSVGYAIDDSWDDNPLLNVNRLRSFLYEGKYSRPCRLTLEKQFANFKSLRALKLAKLGIEIVPSSIGELKHLRYLDIASNTFKRLPDAITDLVNLCMLDISRCRQLEVLPNQFRKLTNLRGLLNNKCNRLMHMPLDFGKFTSLQRLDEFIVSRKTDGGQGSKLSVLSRLKLRRKLRIRFKDETDHWDGVDSWQPPLHLQLLVIVRYKGIRIPNWDNGRAINKAYLLPSLTSLSVIGCSRVKCLPPFRHLPNLNDLTLNSLDELEYIQGDEEVEEQDLNAIFLPDLKELELRHLKKLKGWSRKVEVAIRSKEENIAATTSTTALSTPPPPLHLLSFPSLTELTIKECPELNHMLLCPSLHSLILKSVKAKVIHQLLLLPMHDNSFPSNINPPSSLQFVKIKNGHDLVSFPGEFLTSLQHLCINGCSKLKHERKLGPFASQHP